MAGAAILYGFVVGWTYVLRLSLMCVHIRGRYSVVAGRTILRVTIQLVHAYWIGVLYVRSDGGAYGKINIR